MASVAAPAPTGVPSGPLQLRAVQQAPAQAMSDCAFVSPADFASLCAAARIPPEQLAAAGDKGLLCAVNEAVMLTKYVLSVGVAPPSCWHRGCAEVTAACWLRGK